MNTTANTSLQKLIVACVGVLLLASGILFGLAQNRGALTSLDNTFLLANVSAAQQANCSYSATEGAYVTCRVGQFRLDNTGPQQFTLETVGGSRVYVNGDLVQDLWNDQAQQVKTFTVDVQTQLMSVRIETPGWMPDARVNLSWEHVPVPEYTIVSIPVDGRGGDTALGDGRLDQVSSPEVIELSPAEAGAFNILLGLVGQNGQEASEDFDRFAFVLTNTQTGQVVQNRAERGAPYAVFTDNGQDATEAGLPFSRYKLDVTAYHADGLTVLAQKTVLFELRDNTPASPVASCALPGQLNIFVECIYDGRGFENLIEAREVQQVDYDWGSGGPIAGLQDRFSMRWMGRFEFSQAGEYVFTARVDDGVRIIVNGEPLLSSWRDQAPTTYQETIQLSAGIHEIVIEYYENGGGAVAEAAWEFKAPLLVLPAPNLSLSTITDAEVALSVGGQQSGIAGVRLLRNGSRIAELPADTNVYRDTNVEPDTSYVYTAVAFNSDDVESLPSAPLRVRTSPATAALSCDYPENPSVVTSCFYEGQTFNELFLVRPDTEIDFDWGRGTLVPGLPSDNVSVRWLMRPMITQAGIYEFSMRTDDGMRVFIDDQLVFSEWRPQAATSYRFQHNFEEGRPRIRVEYYERTGNAVAQMSYRLVEPLTVDTLAPNTPRLALEQTTPDTVRLRVDNLVDNVGVAQLDLVRDGVQIRTFDVGAQSLVLEDTNLASATQYSYFVRARDAAGNASSPSSSLLVTTSSEVVVTPPTPGIAADAMAANHGENFVFSGYPAGDTYATDPWIGARMGYHTAMYWGDENTYPGPDREIGIPTQDPDIVIAPGTGAGHVSVISQAIANAPINGVVLLEAGVHEVYSPIIINRSDVHLLGDSNGQTVLREMNPKSQVGSILRVATGGRNPWEYEIGQVDKGSYQMDGFTFTSAAASRLSPGDLVMLDGVTEDTVARKWIQGRYVPMKAMGIVESVSGNEVRLKHRIAMNPLMDDSPEIDLDRIDIVFDNITLGRLRFEYANVPPLTSAMINEYENFDSACPWVHPLQIEHANKDLHLYDLSFGVACSGHIDWNRALEGYAENISTEGSRNRGSGGPGYGITLTDTFYTVINGFHSQNNRHAVVFSFTGSASYNVVMNISGNVNSDFHESYYRGNFITMSDLDIPPAHKGGMPSWDPRNQCWDTTQNTWLGQIIKEGDAGFNIMRAGNSGSDFVVSHPTRTWGYTYRPTTSGGDFVSSGPGDDTVTFSNDIRFSSHGIPARFLVSGGNDVLRNFRPEQSKLLIPEGFFGVASFSQLTIQSDTQGDAKIVMSPEDTVTLVGVGPAEISSQMIEFIPDEELRSYCPQPYTQNHINYLP